MEIIIEYLIAKGGLWGVFLALSIMWIFWRETFLKKNEKEDSGNKEDNEVKDLLLTHAKELKYSQQSSLENLKDIKSILDSFKETNEENSIRIEKLNDQLQKVNDDRVDELKNILSDYNRTMKELNMGLEQIKFFLRQVSGD